MSNLWFMIGLATLQFGVVASLMYADRSNLWLAGVYLCYGISNLLMIGVAAK